MMWKFLESVKFYYGLRDSPEHAGIVELTRRMIENIPLGERKPTLDKVLVILSGENENPLFREAADDYNEFYSGMTNEQLYDYARYLSESFGFRPRRKSVSLDENSF